MTYYSHMCFNCKEAQPQILCGITSAYCQKKIMFNLLCVTNAFLAFRLDYEKQLSQHQTSIHDVCDKGGHQAKYAR